MRRPPPPSVSPGTVLADSYRVGGRLGIGGMGEVFEAVHLESGSTVAIKLLREEASDTVVERFEREGRALAQLESEHVIRVYDVGVLASGRPYIVMELLVGADLGVVKKQRGALTVDMAVDYVLQACVGLAEAHGLGIVHRDLKPPNLYRAELPDGRQLVKVLDFGIAKVNASAKAGKTGLTAADDVFGSPEYMPPEQLHATRDTDVRADVWSLGITLAELVSGRTPFKADDLGTLIFNILEAEPPSIAHLDPLRGATLDAVVRRCLARQPDDRYPSVVALAEALAPLVSSGPQAGQRVAATFEAARARAAALDGRSRPQVTRTPEHGGRSAHTAVLRIAIAPIPHTMALGAAHTTTLPTPATNASMPAAPHGPAADAVGAGRVVGATAPAPTAPLGPSPSPRRQKTWLAVAAAVGLAGIATVTVLARGGGATTGARADDDDSERASSQRAQPLPAPTRADKSKRAAESPAPLERLEPTLASRSPFDIADAIGGLVARSHGEDALVRDVLLFPERAAVVLGAAGATVRRDYARGELSAPRPMTAESGARVGERIRLSQLDLTVVAEIAREARAHFGDGQLHSISLLWLADRVLWVAAAADGRALRFGLDGQRVAER